MTHTFFTFTISKQFLFFFLFYSLSSLSFAFCLYTLNHKLDVVMSNSIALTKENVLLKEQISLLNDKLFTQTEVLPVVTKISNTAVMSEEYKMFLIKIFLILTAISLCGFGLYYCAVYFNSMLFGNVYMKSILALNTSCTNFIYRALGHHFEPTEYIYTDVLDNVIKVLVSDQTGTIEVQIKVPKSDIFVNITEFLGRNPDFFSKYEEASTRAFAENPGILQAATSPSVTNVLDLFNSLN